MRGFAKQLEGWQVGALVVFIATSISSVTIPRSAEPDGLPPPVIRPEQLYEARAQSSQVAERMKTAELPRSARILGGHIRALGRAERDNDELAIAQAHDGILNIANQALRESGEAVELIRDYQAARFRQAYLAFLRHHEESDDWVELGGAMLAQFARNGWNVSFASTGSHIDILLEGFFKRRFNRLLGKKESSSATEERVILGFLMEHPPPAGLEEGNSGGDGTGPFLLRRIDDLALLEPGYPVNYAKGIVLFRIGHFEASAAAFDSFLLQGESGPYRLRAVNYLKAAVEHSEAL